MLAGASAAGVCLLMFIGGSRQQTQIERLKNVFRAELVPGATPHLDKLRTQLNEYFAGTRQGFELDLDLRGTAFQLKAWRALQTIPYGATCSYKDQARKVGNIKATRAVAGANGANRIAIVLPCHRVIGKNGQLVGYGSGLWRKEYLLDLEQKHVSPATS
jgi:AraC family transcriptional regulator of adaptative response/methylated-DNA-[protein]-cysteine methyltransferase